MQSAWPCSFERLVEEHQAMVFSIALRLTAERALAEEIAQDVFLELDRHVRELTSGEHARNWLRMVAVNRSRDAMRRRTARGWWQSVEVAEHHAVVDEARGSPLATRVEQLVALLPEAQREAIVLRYQEEMTPAEIAEMLRTPLATVKSNLQRGLKRLRDGAAELKEFVRDA